MRSLLLAALLLLGPAAQAQGLDVAAERARIDAERRAADARFTAQERACRARFAVNDCTAEARARHRVAVGALRRQEIALNDMERRRKAAEKLRELEERRSPEAVRQEARERTEAVRERKAREARQADKAGRREAKAPRAPLPPRRTASATPKPPVLTPAEAEANRRAYEERVKEAEDHRAKVKKRLAERKKPAAAPLPAAPQ